MLKVPVQNREQSESSVIEEDVTKNYTGIEAIRGDLNRLDSMTVKELREMISCLVINNFQGVSTRGSKKDLIFGLKRFSKTASNGTPSTVEVEDHRSDVSEKKEKRDRRKQGTTVCTILEDKSKAIVEEEKLSSIMEEIVSKKRARVSKKVSSIIQTEEKTNGILGEVPEPWTVLAHKKPQAEWIPYIPNKMRPPPLTRDTNFVKLMSWNVNGLRDLLKLKSFSP